MKITNKMVDRAEEKADSFFETLYGEDIGIVGLTILFIAGGFIIDCAEDRESALEGLNSLHADLEAAIIEAFPTIN
jgi:hypothetical protein